MTFLFQAFLELLKQLFLILRQVNRCFNDNPAQQIAGIATAHRCNAFAPQTEQFTGLGFGWNFQFYAAIQSRHFQLTTQGSIDETDGHFGIKILAFTTEDGMITHRHLHIQITGRASIEPRLTLTGQANTVAGIHTRGNFYRQGFALFFTALAMTIGTGILDDFALAATRRTGLLHREKALLHAHLTHATAGITGDRVSAFFGTGTITGIAMHHSGNPDLNTGAFNRLFQIQFQGIAQIRAAVVAAATASTTTAKDIPEHISEYIAEAGAGAGTSVEATAAHVGINTGMTVLVIGGLFLFVGKHFVSFGGFLEFRLRLFVVRVTVGMIFHGQLTIGFFNILRTGALAYPEYFVKISFRHAFRPIR